MAAASPVRLSLRYPHNGKGRPVLFQSAQRNFSSPTVQRLSSSCGHHGPPNRLFLRPHTLQHRHQTIRLASTTTTISSVSEIPATSTQTANPWDTPGEFVSEGAVSIERHIGWLREMGLDFGWGPTSMIQWLLEHVYVYSGLPWGGSVVVAAILIRLTLAKAFLNSSDAAARQATLTPHIAPIQAKLAAARETRDQTAMLEAWKEQRALYRKADFKFSRLFIPILLQMPIGYGYLRLTRNMATLPVPGLDTNSFLWVHDLTAADPTYLLPAISAGLMYFTLKRSENGVVVANQMKETMGIMRKTFPFVTFLFLSWFPALTQIALATTGFLAFIQSRILMNNAWRRRLGIYPLPQPSPKRPGQNAGPYKGTLNKYQSSTNAAPLGQWAQLKKKAESYMAKKEGRLSSHEKREAERYEQRRRNEIEAEIVDREKERRRR